MGLFSFFQGGAKYFDKKIDPKCDYCSYGKRTKDGNRVLCEKRGLVEQNYSCKAFIYSPLKRIPVKQLRFVGSIADDELYIESKGDRTEKEAAEKKANEETAPKPKTEAPAQAAAPAQTTAETPAPAQEAPAPAPVQQTVNEGAQEASSLAEAAKAAEEALNSGAQNE
ncbi:hypothetical protein [Ruminococcus sp.]|uniref:hypothetical protein n=1 Tax=Ruminococcus sp. TaxID=41978 RepID=UPI002B70FB09|nr:hypothetical protein [Ruminococcus sp.]HNZ99931.1 hypothetical protein [Ruminococcus sp.]HOH87616.1 hypothetical protein [Ruminococcus sp.]